MVLLLLTVACKGKNSVKVAEGEIYLTYSTENTLSWTSGNVEKESFEGAGECSLSGSDIVYTKTDKDFNGVDYCVKAGEETPPNYCEVESYQIDFSEEVVELVAKLSICE
jgi:hypothetical protein